MKKYISFSIFGDNSLYCKGLLQNLELIPKIYNGWRPVIFIAENCPLLSILEKSYDCDLRIMPPQDGVSRENKDWTWNKSLCAMMWRMFILDELEEGDVVLFRDCDSRISERESKIVYEWIKSPYAGLVFAENVSHRNAWMSGMLSLKGGILSGVRDSIERWIEHYKTRNHPWIFCDLEYNNCVLQPAIGSSVVGVGYGYPNTLPELKEGEKFIGEVCNGEWRNEIFDPQDWILKNE